MASKLESPATAGSSFERTTRQREAILDTFAGADGPLSTSQVLERARGAGASLSLATVYRAIRALVDEGAVAVVELPGGGAFYELAGKGHHHHFSCVTCRRVFELDGCLDSRALEVPRGFRALSHELTVNGFCRECRPPGAPPRKRKIAS